MPEAYTYAAADARDGGNVRRLVCDRCGTEYYLSLRPADASLILTCNQCGGLVASATKEDDVERTRQIVTERQERTPVSPQSLVSRYRDRVPPHEEEETDARPESDAAFDGDQRPD